MVNFLFVIGDPIAHSLSPVLHNKCIHQFKKKSLYLPVVIKEMDVEGFSTFARKSTQVVCFNVTLPHKESMMSHLDWVEEKSQIIGAVNCVRVSQGRLFGYNTDAEAFGESVFQKRQFEFTGKRILLFGAGGGSRALIYQLCKDRAEEVVICNRTSAKSVSLKNHFSKQFKQTFIKTIPFHEIDEDLGVFDLIINATSLTEDFDMSVFPLSASCCQKSTLFFDVNYGPGRLVLKTWLDKSSRSHRFLKNVAHMDGQDMLIRQAAKSFSFWYKVNYHDCVAAMYQSIKHIKGRP